MEECRSELTTQAIKVFCFWCLCSIINLKLTNEFTMMFRTIKKTYNIKIMLYKIGVSYGNYELEGIKKEEGSDDKDFNHSRGH